jgi:hypothetical protein
MDSLFFHPKMVHLPMALAVVMPLVAGGLLLSWWRGWLPRQAWLVAVGLQAILLSSGVLALQSGEAEEDRVERVVPERLIEQHEEAAQVFTSASAGVFGLMLLAAWFGSRRAGLPIASAATACTLVVLWLGYRTGEAGGSLVYQHGAADAYTGTAASSGEEGLPAPAEVDDD